MSVQQSNSNGTNLPVMRYKQDDQFSFDCPSYYVCRTSNTRKFSVKLVIQQTIHIKSPLLFTHPKFVLQLSFCSISYFFMMVTKRKLNIADISPGQTLKFFLTIVNF